MLFVAPLRADARFLEVVFLEVAFLEVTFLEAAFFAPPLLALVVFLLLLVAVFLPLLEADVFLEVDLLALLLRERVALPDFFVAMLPLILA